METGDVWLGLIAFAPFALLGFAFLYLPVGAFILAAKGARISWRDLLLGALVLSGALYAGVAVGGLAYLQGPTDGGVYSALILAIFGAGVAVYFVSLFGTALASARMLRRALSGAGERSARQFAAAQTLLAALIVIAAPIGLGIYALFSGEEAPNFSYPHLNPLSAYESLPIAVSAAALAGNFLIHIRSNALPCSSTAIASGVGVTAALFAALWWVFTWYVVVMGIIIFYICAAQFFALLSRFASTNFRYFGLVAALIVWAASVQIWAVINDVRWDT